MLTDALLNFVPIGGNLSLVAGAGIAIPSTGIIDLLGLGVGVAPSERIIGLPSSGLFGEDAGIGAVKPQVQVNLLSSVVPTAGTGTPTLNIAFQGAPDTAGTHLPGAWQTLVETGPLTVAQLVAAASATLGYPLARFDFPPAFPPGLNARYLRLLFSPAAATNFATLTVASAIITMVRDDWAAKYAAENFTVGALN
jgi:hypothetical protein